MVTAILSDTSHARPQYTEREKKKENQPLASGEKVLHESSKLLTLINSCNACKELIKPPIRRILKVTSTTKWSDFTKMTSFSS